MKDPHQNSTDFKFYQVGLVLMFVWMSYIVFQLHQSIVTNCPNSHLLGWDPSSRFSISLKMADSIRHGNIWEPIFIFLDSPTWPSLRNFWEAICILLLNPTTSISNNTTFFTFFILLSTVGLILFKTIPSVFRFVFYYLFFLLTIFHSEIFMTYTYSGMLEIQGSLTLLLCIEGLILVFSSENKSIFAKWLLPVSCFLLLQTKYPYAMMFLFSLTLYYGLLHIKEIPKLVLYYFQWFWKLENRRPILFVFPIPILILILGSLNLIPTNTKMRLLLFQLTIILFTIDSSHFIYKQSTNFSKNFFQLSYLWFTVYIPSLIWILIHPDRFNSLFSTIQHQQGGGNFLLYFETILKDLSIPIYIWILLFGLFFYIAYLYKVDVWKKRFAIYLGIPFLILIGQILSTSNHQERHIYHIYPALILVVIFFIEELYQLILSKFNSNKIIQILGVGILFISILYLGVGNYSMLANLSPICYVENKSDVSYIPKWTEKLANSFLISPTLLINDLNSNHINRPDSQLILEITAYKNKIPILIQPKKITDPSHWNTVVRISNACSKSSIQDFLEKKLESEFTLDFLKEESLASFKENPSACLEKYKIHY